MADLNPDQFFHGTTAAIKDGMVRPGWDVGKEPSEYSLGDPGDMSEGDHAFVIKNDEDYAWHAANSFHTNGRRPRVYETDSAPDMKPGPWNKDHPDFLEHAGYGDAKEFPPHENPEAYEDAVKNNHQDEYASKTGFPIRKRIDIMPGRQGTFPEVNWNRFRALNGGRAPVTPQDGREAMARGGPDANHPTDTIIATPLSEQFKIRADQNLQESLVTHAKDAERKVVEYGLRGKTRNRVLPIVPSNKREATLFD